MIPVMDKTGPIGTICDNPGPKPGQNSCGNVPVMSVAPAQPHKRSAGRRTGTPLYHQLYLVLSRQLRDRHFPAGRPLPSEPDLAAQHGVSRVTIRRTLERLEREGLVRRRRGAGTFPCATETGGGQRDDISAIGSNLFTLDMDTEAEVLDFHHGPASGAVCEALGLPDGSDCLSITRLRRKAGRPVSHTVIHVPGTIAEGIDKDVLGGTPVTIILNGLGHVMERAEQAITVAVAEPGVAERLGLDVGAALLAMRRVVFDADGRAILHQLSLYPPDRYEYRMTLTRDSGSATLRWTPIG